jgi:prepilin-type N-terminal cleavage/methylation domain-containing protein
MSGFTLVEVIVVIVIIAILAAIGVPALTGYIDKAQDKKYILQARDFAIAMRACLDEGYANGDFADPKGYPGYEPDYTLYKSTSIWETTEFSYSIYIDSSIILRRAYALVGREYPTGSEPDVLNLIGTVGSTWQNADGFMYYTYPEGLSSGKPCKLVTYKVVHIDIADGSSPYQFKVKAQEGHEYYLDNTTSIYDPNAGYEVYHLTV